MTEGTPAKVDMEKIVSLSRRRGFIFPSSEIYGGLQSCWDYGPLGVELKRNVKEAWWRAMVQERDDMVGMDASIMMHPKTWEASGHVEGFADPLVECKNCHMRWKADELVSNECPSCGGEVTEPRLFNLMFRTFMGPVEDDASVVYLRPETAQGMFVNFQNVLNTTRKRLPFGIAQIGKAFRNEITTGNFIFRSREFEQMEIEYFVKPGTDKKWFDYWLEERLNWYVKLGIKREHLRLREHGKEELSHYSRRTVDINYLFPMGWAELEGIANRGDFDLVQHAKYSGKSLDYFDEEAKEHFIPYIIEPSAGVDRSALAFLCDAYHEEPARGETVALLRLHPALAPIKVAVLPLSRQENLVSLAKQIYADLHQHWMVDYDDAQSIGRRYRRQDEIGTPFSVTIDFQSLEDNQVTIRERDTANQIRVPISELKTTLQAKLSGEPFKVLPRGVNYWWAFRKPKAPGEKISKEMAKRKYTLQEVQNDIRSFFTDDSHRLFSYGTPTPHCNKDRPFHKRTLQVLFEDDYPHDFTLKAVQALVQEGFLKMRVMPINDAEVHFLHRYNLRYVVRLLKHPADLIRQYSDYRISKATGDYAEMLFSFMFRLNGFKVVARNVSEYDGTKWVKTRGYDLDLIVEKDGITYGVEIKNTFDYMPSDEFQAKLEICKRFDIVPLFALRCPSDHQFEVMRSESGLALKFKTRIFPPGQEQLVLDIWNFMRLPVSVWKEIPQRIEQLFLNFHSKQLAVRKSNASQ